MEENAEELIRARLNADRVWSVYALGDLTPARARYCDWRANGDGVVLLYREYHPPILFAAGPLVIPIDEPELQLQVREDALHALADAYELKAKPVWRMAVDGASFTPAPGRAIPLDASHAGQIERLYASGAPDERPDFFFPGMIEGGSFHGVMERDRLIAVAGTHLVNEAERVAAVGNVFTHPDRRGRGLAGVTTSAVTAALFARGIDTVALNVREGNSAAGRVYERLGFRRHCRFYEGSARRLVE